MIASAPNSARTDAATIPPKWPGQNSRTRIPSSASGFPAAAEGSVASRTQAAKPLMVALPFGGRAPGMSAHFPITFFRASASISPAVIPSRSPKTRSLCHPTGFALHLTLPGLSESFGAGPYSSTRP